jgi:cytochrome P450
LTLNRYEEEFINGQQLSLSDQDKWFKRIKHQKLRANAFDFFHTTALERKSGPRIDDSLDLLLQRKRVAASTVPLTDSELTEAVYLLTVAGVGNIARILCPLLWSINDTQWLPRLRQEVRGFDPALLAGMKNFPVLRAIIAETERCFAPAPIVPKRTTKDIEFMGVSIPAGTLIMHLHALSHFDQQRYPDPLKFDPARWIAANPEKPNAFGGGKHMCLGMGVTRIYLPLILATLFSHHGLEIEHAPLLDSLEPGFQPAPVSTVMNATLTQRPG